MLSQSMENYLKAIYEALEKNERATTSAIAKIMGVSRTAFYHFIRTRKLGPEAKKAGRRA